MMPSEWIANNGVRPVPIGTRVMMRFDDGSEGSYGADSSWCGDEGTYRPTHFRVINCNVWYDWLGGTPPVPSGTPMMLRLRGGAEIELYLHDWDLNDLELSGDILAYKFISADANDDSRSLNDVTASGGLVLEIGDIANISSGVSIFSSTIPNQVEPEEPPVFKPDDWHDREGYRLRVGIYKQIPSVVLNMVLNNGDGFIIPPSHYIHQGISDKSKIVYTENDKMGRADRQTVVRIGKYLKKFTEFSDPEIADIANMYRTEVVGVDELQYARTQKEIVSVYRNGPVSCMSHKLDDYLTDGIHPVSVYATPSVAVLYLERGDRITARTVTNEIMKTYNTIYGDRQTMKPILKEMGYTYGDLEGCSLLRLTNNNGDIILPYLDGEVGIVDCGDRLMVECGGDIRADQTNGLAVSGVRCDDCGEHYHEDELYYSEYHEMHVCENCISEWYHAYDGLYQDWYMHDYAEFYRYGDDWYTEEGLSSHNLVLIDGEVYSEDDVIWCEIDNEYSQSDYVYCYLDDNDDEYYTNDHQRITEPEDSDEMYLFKDLWEFNGKYYRLEENYLIAKEEDNDERVA